MSQKPSFENKVDDPIAEGISSVIPERQLSSSASDVQTLEGISFSMSTEHHTFSKSDKLNATYIVPTVLDDKTNSIQNSPDEPCIASKKKVFKKLVSQVSSQPINEEPCSPIVPKFGGLPVFSTNPVQKPVDRENFLSKKLKLLEKRFSPSKEFSLVSSEENFNVKSVIKNDGIQKMTTSNSKSVDKLVSPVKASSPNVVCVEEINSVKAASNSADERSTSPFSNQNPEKDTPMQKEILGEMQPSLNQYTEEIPLKSNTSVFEEESFISQPFPCGQPPSNTQCSVKSSPNITETQSLIDCQGAESTPKENATEKADVPIDVFYEKSGGQVEVNDSVPIKDKVGGKRKRKSKGEKSSKKLVDKNSLVCIQYSAKQVQDMIEIMKHFQFEKKMPV